MDKDGHFRDPFHLISYSIRRPHGAAVDRTSGTQTGRPDDSTNSRSRRNRSELAAALPEGNAAAFSFVWNETGPSTDDQLTICQLPARIRQAVDRKSVV